MITLGERDTQPPAAGERGTSIFEAWIRALGEGEARSKLLEAINSHRMSLFPPEQVDTALAAR